MPVKVMSPDTSLRNHLPGQFDAVMDEIFQRCTENAPNFGVSRESFKTSLEKTINKYLL